jgi:hypothetical protein
MYEFLLVAEWTRFITSKECQSLSDARRVDVWRGERPPTLRSEDPIPPMSGYDVARLADLQK